MLPKAKCICDNNEYLYHIRRRRLESKNVPTYNNYSLRKVNVVPASTTSHWHHQYELGIHSFIPRHKWRCPCGLSWGSILIKLTINILTFLWHNIPYGLSYFTALVEIMGLFIDRDMPWASCLIREIVGCACAGNAENVFPVGGGESVPGIPGACATRKFTYLVRGPLYRPVMTQFHGIVLYTFYTIGPGPRPLQGYAQSIILINTS